MNDFNDKLLDASLKEYSRVSPPDGFVVRQPARQRERMHWIKLFAPVAAAAVVITLVSIHTDRPVQRPRPVHPIHTVIDVQAAPLPQTLDLRPLRKLPKAAPGPETPWQGSRFRILTNAEIARMDLPAELFAPRVESPITELQVPELSVKPLESDNPIPDAKE
jgi:hypothetical protein